MCSPDGRIQFAKKSFEPETTRKVEFKKTSNEMY